MAKNMTIDASKLRAILAEYFGLRKVVIELVETRSILGTRRCVVGVDGVTIKITHEGEMVPEEQGKPYDPEATDPVPALEPLDDLAIKEFIQRAILDMARPTQADYNVQDVHKLLWLKLSDAYQEEVVDDVCEEIKSLLGELFAKALSRAAVRELWGNM